MEKEDKMFKLNEMKNIIDVAKSVEDIYYEFSDSENNFENKQILHYIFIKSKLGFRDNTFLEYGDLYFKQNFPIKFIKDVVEIRDKNLSIFEVRGEKDYTLKFEPTKRKTKDILKEFKEFKNNNGGKK